MTEKGNIRFYKAGERIVAEGDPGSEIMILRRGEVSVWRGMTELGRVKGEGDLLGELASLTGRPRSASIIAVTDVEMLWIKVDFNTFSRFYPEILEKIDSAIKLRYEIAKNKTAIYCNEAAQARRIILFDNMVKKEFIKAGKITPEKDNQIIKKIRKVLDEEFELHQSSDDPRILIKIADDNNVLTEYNLDLQKQPWLEPALSNRFNDIDNSYKLSCSQEGLKSIRERAKTTVEMLDLLYEFESLPGITKKMDLAKLEDIVPLETRSKALLDVVIKAHKDVDSKDLKFLENKVIGLIEKCKLSSGFDRVQISKAAVELNLLAEYEEELRRIIELAESKSTFVDLMPVSYGDR